MAPPRKDKQFKKMYTEYQKGFSLEQIGKMFGVSRQSVYEGFKNRKHKLRSKLFLPYIFFEGEKYTLRNTGYYGKTRENRELLHRAVWEKHNGKISPNKDIHHKDFDKTNNQINNLELFDKAEHSSLFSTGNNQYTNNE